MIGAPWYNAPGEKNGRTGRRTALVGRYVDKIAAGIVNSVNKNPLSPAHQGMAGGRRRRENFVET